MWARAIASSSDSGFVAPGAIPWLLLEVVGAEGGPTGGGRLTGATYVHRLNTAGGIAPATGCSQSLNLLETHLTVGLDGRLWHFDCRMPRGLMTIPPHVTGASSSALQTDVDADDFQKPKRKGKKR